MYFSVWCCLMKYIFSVSMGYVWTCRTERSDWIPAFKHTIPLQYMSVMAHIATKKHIEPNMCAHCTGYVCTIIWHFSEVCHKILNCLVLLRTLWGASYTWEEGLEGFTLYYVFLFCFTNLEKKCLYCQNCILYLSVSLISLSCHPHPFILAYYASCLELAVF